MSATNSAAREAEHCRRLAAERHREAIALEARAGRFGVAAVTEARTVRALSPLVVDGYRLLPDRRWPGSRHAQVDLVVVGPGGVFVVDTKAWKEPRVEGGRMYRGQADVSDEVEVFAGLGDLVETDLGELGLAPGEVHPVLVLAGRRGLHHRLGTVHVVGEHDVLAFVAGFGRRLGDRQVEEVHRRALDLFPPMPGRDPAADDPDSVSEPEPALAVAAAGPDPADPQDARENPPDDAEVRAALSSADLAAPVEDWMTWLDPGQVRVVRRSFNGPARIRGAAGTGKTAVGLHRAAHLARRLPGTVLVTSYVRTLPAVLHGLVERLAPDVAGRIEFRSVHGFAMDVLAERGMPADHLDPSAATSCFQTAWARVGRHGVLGQSPLSYEYWREEIDRVIKGRGLEDLGDYLDASRTGRGRGITVDQRKAVWDLYGAYQDRLRERGVEDFADVVLRAEAELSREGLGDRYSAVIIDEAQDLSCAMVRMLHRVAGDGPDGLLLIGDGQQNIYPGGYTLAEAGVSVAGRGVVFDVNYRNTAEIFAFAGDAVDGDEYTDIEGVQGSGDVPRDITRHGREPVLAEVATTGEQDAEVVARVRQVVAADGTGPGDVAVLTERNGGAEHFATVLRHHGIPVVSLKEYAGHVTEAVKVGTIARAKGLEFKQVLLPDVRPELLAAHARRPDSESERERWLRDRRTIYVGMTRARDGLWVSSVRSSGAVGTGPGDVAGPVR